MNNTNNLVINYKISPLTKDELFSDSHSQIYYYEISKPDIDTTLSFDYILIKNFYTASIDMLQFYNNSWKTILNEYKLMTEPDCDEEGESYFLINKTKLENFKEESTLFRIYLAQECKEWETYYLKEIKFLKEFESDSKISNPQDNISFNQKDCLYQLNNIKLLHDKEAIHRKYLELNNLDFEKVNINIFK